MSRKQKWITVQSVEEPAPEVARQALEKRLLAVWRCLGPAANKADQDIEHVHQLRVATRRAMAALETFDAFLPNRRGAWFRRQMKRVRKAAGNARDFDVMAERLRTTLEAAQQAAESEHAHNNGEHAEQNADGANAAEKSAPKPRGQDEISIQLTGENELKAAEKFLDSLVERRREEQPAIRQVYSRLRSRHFRQRIAKLCDKIRARETESDPTFAQIAQDGMRHSLEEFLAAADADLSEVPHLHLFRIAGKQLRYRMEIFSGAFSSRFAEDLYQEIAALQERLGAVVDHSTAAAQLETWLIETEDADQRELIARLIAAEAEARDAGVRAFLDYWTPDRRDRLKRQFTQEFDSAHLTDEPATIPTPAAV